MKSLIKIFICFALDDIAYNNPISSHSKRPLGMQLCPCCIEEFYPSECDIYSEREGIVIEPGKTGWLGKRMEPKPLTSPEYRELQACRRCPHCHYSLPYNIEQVDDNISIAIIGDTFSGKSVYLAFCSVPLAVMLSKSDLLRDFYGPIVPPFSYLSGSPHPYPDLTASIFSLHRFSIRQNCAI